MDHGLNLDSERIVIIGGGFSGTMLAARLAERGVASVVVDPAPAPGLGVAYGTPFEGHLLNVRSNRMSAVQDRPNDFVHWLGVHDPDRADPEGFAPRRLYGAYVQDRFRRVRQDHPGRIAVATATATRIDGQKVELDTGEVLRGRAVVLATGNPSPRVAEGSDDAVIRQRLIRDPWAAGALDRVGVRDGIVIIGTGLTMVDMLVWLVARGWSGEALALSRRGLKPRAHASMSDAPDMPAASLRSGPVSQRLHAARQQSRQHGWRPVMEGLRPVTAELWQQAEPGERRRFLRHLRPWWDVHRHRIAPEIATQIETLEQSGRLTFVRGRVQSIERLDPRATAGAPAGNKLVLTYDPWRRIVPRSRIADWVFDCSGPGHDPATDPLTGPLIATGAARLDPLRLGLDLDHQGRVRRADGQASGDLLVLGPPARAAFWETIAVPDIRKRIEAMVDLLSEAR